MTDPSDRPVEHPRGPGRVGPAAARSHDADLVSLKQGYVKFFPVLNDVPLHRRRRAANFLEAVAVKDRQEHRSIGCPDEEVEVFVRSRYATDEEVDCPAAAEPACRAGRLGHRNELLDQLELALLSLSTHWRSLGPLRGSPRSRPQDRP
jgi:hypothetical protein